MSAGWAHSEAEAETAYGKVTASCVVAWVRCVHRDRDRGHHCDLAPGHTGPHRTAGCDGGAT